MKRVLSLILLLTLAACQTCTISGSGPAGPEKKDYGATDLSIMGPDDDTGYPDKGTSFEVGGSISIDAYTIRRKGQR